jgi:hypothetical protein
MAMVNASEPKTTAAYVKKIAFCIVYYGYIPFICYKGKILFVYFGEIK